MSDEVYRQVGVPVRRGILAVCDHASNAVPDDIELGVSAAAMEKHIAWDIGAGGVTERMARRHAIAAHMACVSRLVVDLHREEDNPDVVPTRSDGYLIPGNIGANVESRLDRFHQPYHAALEQWIEANDPKLLLSIHSFTPRLENGGEDRPWEIALLYNQDDRAAQYAMQFFGELGCTVGDNQPYSGKDLNATMNRHAEAHGRPYCAIEIRNDLIANEAGQARYAAMIADVAGRVVLALDSMS